MAITVQYGPMGLAMNLATQAGQGAAYQNQQKVDLEAIGLQNQMQARADQRRATDMQNALAQQQVQQQAATTNAALARQSILDKQQVEQQQVDNQFRAKESAYKDDLASRDQAMQERQFQNQQATKAEQDAARERIGNGHATDADYLLFGKTPPARGMASPDAVETRSELGLMMRQLDDAQKELARHTVTEKDVPDARVPQAKDGHGWMYEDAARKVASIQGRVGQLTDLLQQYTPKPAGAPAPAAAPGAVGAPAPAAPAGTPPEVQTQFVIQGAAANGVRPSDVDQFPPPSLSICQQAKTVVQAKFSNPAQQKAEYYRMLIGMRIDPRKLPDRQF